ncbi:hypothetical protein CKA32_000203 [Geitlerinema sp. FC II]|nr:hypothetical protein CKA32_000203 [Geitlerinema sp. FC II]
MSCKPFLPIEARSVLKSGVISTAFDRPHFVKNDTLVIELQDSVTQTTTLDLGAEVQFAIA